MQRYFEVNKTHWEIPHFNVGVNICNFSHSWHFTEEEFFLLLRLMEISFVTCLFFIYLFVYSPGKRNYPKPGNELLPTFGFCEVFETAKDVLNTKINRHKIVCELSQHILYQYVFIILWFAMVFGIVVSVIGLLVQIIGHLVTVLCFQKAGNHAR